MGGCEKIETIPYGNRGNVIKMKFR